VDSIIDSVAGQRVALGALPLSTVFAYTLRNESTSDSDVRGVKSRGMSAP